MDFCDLLNYSSFIHSYIRLCCKLSSALGQILLAGKKDVGKRFRILTWRVRRVVHFVSVVWRMYNCRLWTLKHFSYVLQEQDCEGAGLSSALQVGKSFLETFFLLFLSPAPFPTNASEPDFKTKKYRLKGQSLSDQTDSVYCCLQYIHISHFIRTIS